MVTPSRCYVSATIMLGSLLFAACQEGPTDVPSSYQVGILSGDQQVGAAGARLPSPLVVRVLDDEGDPARGVRVAWTVDEDGGYVSTPSSPSVTDGFGTARVYRTLGASAGVRETTASLDGAGGQSVRFTSIAQIDGAMRLIRYPGQDGNQQQDTVLATLSPFRVLALDYKDAPVPGVTVTWYRFGRGSLSAQTALTDADGLAESTYTFGDKAWTERVHAAVAGLIGSPVQFEATAEPGNPTEVVVGAGSGQMRAVNEPADPYTVLARDAHGNYVEGVTIDWAVTAGAGSISPAESATEVIDPQFGPYASAIHTLGPAEGVQSVTATARVPGAPFATFETLAVSGIVSVLAPDYYYGYGSGGGFSPEEIEVPADGTVAWVWEPCWSYGWYECPDHDVTFEDDPTEPASSPARQSGSHLRSFGEPGVYRYRCTVHSAGFTAGEVGVVRVLE
jgi:plastocyanin